jgi:hypothetical protein
VTQTGGEVVESVITQFKESECISIEDPLHVQDVDSLRVLKDVSQTPFCVCSYYVFFLIWVTRMSL